MSAVIGSRLAVPRMPSVPNSLRVVDFTIPPGARDGSAARLWLRLDAAGRFVAARGRHGRTPARRRLGRLFERGSGIAHDLLAADDAADLVGGERLELEQALGDGMQIVDMAGQHAARALLAL